jgi:hypothetical protein
MDYSKKVAADQYPPRARLPIQPGHAEREGTLLEPVVRPLSVKKQNNNGRNKVIKNVQVTHSFPAPRLRWDEHCLNLGSIRQESTKKVTY